MFGNIYVNIFYTFGLNQAVTDLNVSMTTFSVLLHPADLGPKRSI